MRLHEASTTRRVRAIGPALLLLGLGIGGSLACDEPLPDPRYPPREADCAVRYYAERPDVPVDELGTVGILCPSCTLQLRAAICRRGADVAWGFGNPYGPGYARGLPRLPPQIAIGHTRPVPAPPPPKATPAPAQEEEGGEITL
jgi:hypothetical protein